jgi:FtsP/CotA-like multicopper oxidase with cupredoxin domain
LSEGNEPIWSHSLLNGMPLRQNPSVIVNVNTPVNRIRIINKSGFAIYHFWIPGVEMSVIEVDGSPVHERRVTSLRVNVGQRYSVLIHTPKNAQQKYPLMIRTSIQTNATAQGDDGFPSYDLQKKVFKNFENDDYLSSASLVYVSDFSTNAVLPTPFVPHPPFGQQNGIFIRKRQFQQQGVQTQTSSNIDALYQNANQFMPLEPYDGSLDFPTMNIDFEFAHHHMNDGANSQEASLSNATISVSYPTASLDPRNPNTWSASTRETVYSNQNYSMPKIPLLYSMMCPKSKLSKNKRKFFSNSEVRGANTINIPLGAVVQIRILSADAGTFHRCTFRFNSI